MAHFDYAVQVWQGQLPLFEEGLAVEPPWGSRPPVQWTSQHPPLFYLLLAPVVGPLYEAGHPYIAGMAGRLVNSALTAGLCIAVMWAVRPFCGGQRYLTWIAGFVAASSPWVMGVGSAIYNDNIAALQFTIILGAASRLVMSVEGNSSRIRRMWWVMGVFAVLAAMTRLALMPLVFVVFVAVVLRGLLRPGQLSRFSWFLRTTLIGVAMIGAAGWFYLRNVRLTGSVSGGHPDWAVANTGRTTPPVLEVASNTTYWAKLFGIFSPGNTPAGITLWGLLIFPVILGGVLAFVSWRSANSPTAHRNEGSGASYASSGDATRRRPLGLAGPLLLVAVVGLLTVMQFVYVSKEAGNLFPRYSLPVLAVTCLLVAWGLGGLRRLMPIMFGSWAILAWWQIGTYLASLPRESSPDQAALQAELAIPLIVVAMVSALAVITATIVMSLREPQASHRTPSGPAAHPA